MSLPSWPGRVHIERVVCVVVCGGVEEEGVECGGVGWEGVGCEGVWAGRAGVLLLVARCCWVWLGCGREGEAEHLRRGGMVQGRGWAGAGRAVERRAQAAGGKGGGGVGYDRICTVHGDGGSLAEHGQSANPVGKPRVCLLPQVGTKHPGVCELAAYVYLTTRACGQEGPCAARCPMMKAVSCVVSETLAYMHH